MVDTNTPFVLPGSSLGQQEVLNSTHSTTEKRATSPSYHSSGIEPLKLHSLQFDNQDVTYRSFKVRLQRVMKCIDQHLQVEYLLQCLNGESLRLAMMHIEDPHALDLIWKTLDERFGNEAVAYHYHTRKLLEIGSYPRCRTSAELKELFYTFNENILALRRISKSSAAGEDFKNILVEVVPDFLQRKMIKIIQRSPHQYTIDHLLKLIGEEVQLNDLQTTITGTMDQPNPTSTADDTDGGQNLNHLTESALYPERGSSVHLGN